VEAEAGAGGAAGAGHRSRSRSLPAQPPPGLPAFARQEGKRPAATPGKARLPLGDSVRFGSRLVS